MDFQLEMNQNNESNEFNSYSGIYQNTLFNQSNLPTGQNYFPDDITYDTNILHKGQNEAENLDNLNTQGQIKEEPYTFNGMGSIYSDMDSSNLKNTNLDLYIQNPEENQVPNTQYLNQNSNNQIQEQKIESKNNIENPVSYTANFYEPNTFEQTGTETNYVFKNDIYNNTNNESETNYFDQGGIFSNTNDNNTNYVQSHGIYSHEINQNPNQIQENTNINSTGNFAEINNLNSQNKDLNLIFSNNFGETVKETNINPNINQSNNKNEDKYRDTFTFGDHSPDPLMENMQPKGQVTQFTEAQNIYHNNEPKEELIPGPVFESIIKEPNNNDDNKNNNNDEKNVEKDILNVFKESKTLYIPKEEQQDKNKKEEPIDNKNQFVEMSIHKNLNKKEDNNIVDEKKEEEKKRNSKKEFSIFDPLSQKILEGKVKINIQFVLIENLRFGQYLFDIICLLGLMPLREFTIEMCEKICLNLNSYNTNEESIISCSSPLLSIALSAELLNKLGNISNKIKYNAESVSKSLLFLGYNIQTSIANEETLNYYLRVQTDLSGRSALEIYAENKFYNMLEDQNVGLIIGKLWYGAEHEHKITSFLRMTRILIANSGELYEHLIKKDYFPSNSRYSFQFCQYVNNCSERNYYESISTMVITLLYQSVVYLYVTFTKEDVTHPKTHFYYPVQIFTNILMLLSIINDILCQIFFRLTGRRVKFEIMHMLIDCCLFLFLLFNFFDIPQLIYPVEKDTDFNILLDGIVYSFLLFLAWMKVLLILRITKIYGPFISIMINIFWHVFNFFIIVICITLLFAQCFCLYFEDSNENYKLIYDSFLTLFNTAWGQVEFTFIDLDIFGEVSLILFTTLSNIMLFNLIVGIVDNLFDQYHEKSEAESRAKLILAHERKKWDNHYGLLILFPSPFNIFSIFLFPILIFSGDNKQKLNIWFSKFCYFFIALIIFSYMIFVGILSYLLALVKSLFQSTYEYLSNKKNVKNKCKVIFISFLKRPFELIIYFVEDCILFWKLVFIETKIDEEKKKQELTTFRRYIITLRKLLNDYKYKEHQSKIPVRDINRKFSLFKKKNTFHFTRVETSSPQNTDAIEEDREWQKMITHTLFLQLNGQKKKKGQDYSETISLTDGYSDTKSFNIYYKHNKKSSKRENIRKKSDVLNPQIIKKEPKKMISININGSDIDDYHYLSNISKDNSTMILQKKITSIEAAKMQMSFHLIKSLWKFIDKFVDPEGIIDIDRALNLLPDRATYDNAFIVNLEYFNIRTFIRGIRKYYFSLEMDNPFYSIHRGNLMIYKLMLKIKMAYFYLPDKIMKKIKTEFENLNDMNKFAKTAEAFQKYEEKDIMSDYDDEGKYAENNNNNYNRLDTSIVNTSKIGGDSDSDHSPPNKSFVSFDRNIESNAE